MRRSCDPRVGRVDVASGAAGRSPPDQGRQTVPGGLPVAVLVPVLGRRHGEHARHEPSGQALRRARPLRPGQPRQLERTDRQLDPAVGGVHALAAGPEERLNRHPSIAAGTTTCPVTRRSPEGSSVATCLSVPDR
jgi:hypothetical protein